MPRLLKDFPSFEPTARGTFSIDFAENIPAGATLASATWTLSIHQVQPYAAVDPDPNGHANGGPTIAGTVVLQSIGPGLVDGNDYLVTATANVSDGEIIVLWCVLPCRAPS